MNVGSGGGGDPEAIIDINTTPLIDVMLVLLIMLIITIPIQTHAVKLDMPRDTSNPPDVLPPPKVDIYIDFDGTVMWDRSPISEPALEAQFRRIGAMPLSEQSEFHIQPNRLVEYKYVARVLAAAQRNNAVKIGLVGSQS